MITKSRTCWPRWAFRRLCSLICSPRPERGSPPVFTMCVNAWHGLIAAPVSPSSVFVRIAKVTSKLFFMFSNPHVWLDSSSLLCLFQICNNFCVSRALSSAYFLVCVDPFHAGSLRFAISNFFDVQVSFILLSRFEVLLCVHIVWIYFCFRCDYFDSVLRCLCAVSNSKSRDSFLHQRLASLLCLFRWSSIPRVSSMCLQYFFQIDNRACGLFVMRVYLSLLLLLARVDSARTWTSCDRIVIFVALRAYTGGLCANFRLIWDCCRTDLDSSASIC